MNKLKLITLLILCWHFPLCTEENEKQKYIIAVSEFKFENATSRYSAYTKIVPQMFLSYLEGKAQKLELLDEKKARALIKAGSDKLKLIKERDVLMKEKDNIFFSIEAEKVKKQKREKLKKQIENKEIEIKKADIEIKVSENKFYDEKDIKEIALWKNGESLYSYDEPNDLAYSLQKDGISALVSGTLKDVSGYLILKVRFETGLKGVPIHTFTEAGKYEEIEDMVKKISSQIYTVIQNTREIKLFFDVLPKEAKIYIDGNIIEDLTKPITLHEGKYSIEASCKDYITSTKNIILKEKNYYKLKINLKKENNIALAFALKDKGDMFVNTRYYGLSDMQLKLPYQTTAIEVEKDKIHTYVFLDKDKIPINEFTQNMIVHLNQKETKRIVERQRKIMYWSLGALYVALPAYLILNGIYSDRKIAFDNGRLANTTENIQNIKNLSIANTTIQSVAIVAGINYFIQLVIYLVFSDRALPKQPKILKDKVHEDIYEIKEEASQDKEKTNENNKTQ